LITKAGELFSELQLASELSNTRSFHFFIGEGGGRGGGGEERRGEEQATDIKSNNPHLAGGERWKITIFNG